MHCNMVTESTECGEAECKNVTALMLRAAERHQACTATWLLRGPGMEKWSVKMSQALLTERVAGLQEAHGLEP